ncbi:MAG: CoA synthetase [Gammaproteobacteria bacterium]|nr:CoA synthetase [Gammaproteobacteria bacterium]
MSSVVSTLDELVAGIGDGATLAVPKDYSGVAMAATRALLRRGVKNLHIVGVPVCGMQVDILIGAGAVRTIETSAVTLGEYGPAPRFTAAVRAGTIRVLDATCPAIHGALQAAEKGLPFMPIRGVIGSDLLAHRSDWQVMDNPFQPGDRIVALPAIRPDVALFHAPLADRHGNVWIGRNRELVTIAHASATTLVSVEEIVDRSLLDDPILAPATIPDLYVTRIAAAPRGTAPLALAGRYPPDAETLARYAQAAKTEAGFRAFLDEWLASTAA